MEAPQEPGEPSKRAEEEQRPHYIQQRKNLVAAFREHGDDNGQPVGDAAKLGITVSNVANILVKLRRREHHAGGPLQPEEPRRPVPASRPARGRARPDRPDARLLEGLGGDSRGDHVDRARWLRIARGGQAGDP